MLRRHSVYQSDDEAVLDCERLSRDVRIAKAKTPPGGIYIVGNAGICRLAEVALQFGVLVSIISMQRLVKQHSFVLALPAHPVELGYK